MFFQNSSSSSKKKALQPSTGGKQTTLFGANGLFNFSAKTGTGTGFTVYQDPEKVSKEPEKPESPKDVEVQTTLSGVTDNGKCVNWTIARKTIIDLF